MRTAARALCAAALLLAGARSAPAQERDALVLPPGMLRLRVDAALSRFDERFGDGSREPLVADLLAPLDSRTFPPLGSLETRLNDFLRGVQPDGAPLLAGPENLLLGAPDLDAVASTRVVPLELAAGILPRIELFVRVPLVREEILLTRYGFPDATLGANPDPEGNAAALAGIGEEWRDLGASALLPRDSSALGKELLRLVEALAPGAALLLPAAAADSATLNDLLRSRYGVAGLASGARAWRPGDASVGARFLALSSFGAALLPADSLGTHYRVAVSAAARLPTGVEPDTVDLLGFLPGVGLAGVEAGADADLFVGRRGWATASLRVAALAGTEVRRRVVAPGAPLGDTTAARAVRWSPGARASLRLAPRYRLTESIALGATYALDWLGGSSYEAADGATASVLDTDGGAAHRLGATVRYSTLPAYQEGRGLLPVEFSVGYERTMAGSAGFPAASRAHLQASLHHRLWGGAPR